MELALKFDDCPYNCTNGRLLDRKLKQMVPCPYCSSKRQELAKENTAMTDEGRLESLPDILGVKNEYMKPIFDYSLIIPDGERLFLNKESLDRQGDVANELYLALSVGQVPDRS